MGDPSTQAQSQRIRTGNRRMRLTIKSPVLALVRRYKLPEPPLNQRPLGIGQFIVIEFFSDALEQLPHGT
jgi:hypothetical protein